MTHRRSLTMRSLAVGVHAMVSDDCIGEAILCCSLEFVGSSYDCNMIWKRKKQDTLSACSLMFMAMLEGIENRMHRRHQCIRSTGRTAATMGIEPQRPTAPLGD